jgi:hypothetical protein
VNQTDRDYGIGLVDILFALVVGEGLVALGRVLVMPAAGRAHLIFATVLTITSWIGYHRSAYRYTGSIGFNPRNPSELIALSKFTLDILLVVLYWTAVRTTEWGYASTHQAPSWRWPISIAVAAFGIYVIWDLLGWLGDGRGRGPWADPRRIVSAVGFGVMLIILGIASVLKPHSDDAVAALDGVLVLITLLYRVAKDAVPGRGDLVRERRLNHRLQEAEGELAEIRRHLEERQREVNALRDRISEARITAAKASSDPLTLVLEPKSGHSMTPAGSEVPNNRQPDIGRTPGLCRAVGRHRALKNVQASTDPGDL